MCHLRYRSEGSYQRLSSGVRPSALQVAVGRVMATRAFTLDTIHTLCMPSVV